jgi:hypothetical protein
MLESTPFPFYAADVQIASPHATSTCGLLDLHAAAKPLIIPFAPVVSVHPAACIAV